MSDDKGLTDEQRERLDSRGERRLDAYYYGFDETGSESVDRVLAAVALAGKRSHSTEMWHDSDDYDWGYSLAELIQAAAVTAAAEVDRLRAGLTTIATHWPGKWTRQCVECEIGWPCQPALDAVTPYMDDDAEDGTEVEAADEIELLRAAMQDAITEIGAVHREATGLPWCVTCGTADGSWPCASSVTGDELRRALDGTS